MRESKELGSIPTRACPKDRVPRFLTLPTESLISKNPSKTVPTSEEARTAFLSAAFALRDTIRELVARMEGVV